MFCHAACGAMFKHEHVRELFLKYRYNAWFSFGVWRYLHSEGGQGHA